MKIEVLKGSIAKDPKGGAVVEFVKGSESEVISIDGVKKIRLGTNGGKLEKRKLTLFLRRILSIAKTNNVKTLHISFNDLLLQSIKTTDEELAERCATDFEMANYEVVKYKSKKDTKKVDAVFLYTTSPSQISTSIKKGKVIGEEVNLCRELCNTPGGEMTPRLLADSARRAVKGLNIKVEVTGESQMKKLKMGGILGVGAGSKEESKLITLEYYGGKKSDKPVVLIGKGVTFDTGGLNIKPSANMTDMHLDMSGGGSVIHIVALAGKLKIKKNIIGIIPAVENMPSGSSIRPGDILRMMSGKTVEIGNTDAEGRIILGDSMTYAKKYEPEMVVDIATLTGGAMMAFGSRVSALFTDDEKLSRRLVKIGQKYGDSVWPLPMWEEYDREIKGTFGDICNIGKSSGGGAIQAAMFLKHFAKDFPSWVHVDIAPRMTATDDEYLSKGSPAAGVRLIGKFLELTDR